MQKDFNRLRTGFVGACAALALMQGCVNDVKYVRLHQEYQRHLKAEAEFLQDLVLILQNGHFDPAQIVSKFEKVKLSRKEHRKTVMWLSRKRIMLLEQEITECRKEVQNLKHEMNEQVMQMAEKILRQPEELSKEIDSQKKVDAFVNEFIRH